VVSGKPVPHRLPGSLLSQIPDTVLDGASPWDWL
jgi:hypothetical protein